MGWESPLQLGFLASVFIRYLLQFGLQIDFSQGLIIPIAQIVEFLESVLKLHSLGVELDARFFQRLQRGHG